MNYGDRLRDTVIPEMQGSNAKGCRVQAISRSSGFQPSYPLILRPSPLALAWDGCAGTALSGSTCADDTVRVPLQARQESDLPRCPAMESDTWGKGIISTSRLTQPRVQSNDIVEFDNQPGTWEVVAPVNGSKADVRRSGGFDTRIVTARLESLIVVRRAGSPGYSY